MTHTVIELQRYMAVDFENLIQKHHDLESQRDALLEALRGCRDMLSESAKQHRLRGDSGHAATCEDHVRAANKAEGSET